MTSLPTILSITGSDGTGGAGVQADVITISALGGSAATAITSVTVQGLSGIHSVHALPPEVLVGQVRAVVDDLHPAAIKLGLVSDAAAMTALRDYIVGCPCVVVDPGILSSDGTPLMDPSTESGQAALAALRRHILPETTLLLLRCSEAELLLGTRIATDDDMLRIARQLTEMGPQWVMLRGGQHTEGRLTALLYGDCSNCSEGSMGSNCSVVTNEHSKHSEQYEQFFSSYNIEGWQRHGVGGALSSAIATRLALGDDVPEAVRRAHDYLHRQVVYAVSTPFSHKLGSGVGQRPAEHYNRLLSLVAAHHRTAHDVAFYADQLAITTRYLSQVTNAAVGKSPKQVIAEYILHEAETLLRTTSLTIKEVSTRLGFSSQVQFGKFVQKLRHCSPTELRRMVSAQ